MSLVIIDYDAGNIGSVLNAFKYLKLNAILSDNINELKESDGIILPGVGSFDAGIRALKKKKLFSVVRELIERGKPYLGICLGLQMLYEGSDEGEEQGFSIFPGMIKKFDSSRVKDSKNNFKIPQIGWNQIEIKKKSPILENIT
ncbi:MAG: imidazole glycerol phosphate synthase subunit HisH, partial [Actinomycetia bacterium]|nr:imidazole glycerol phosphate synthase subunit HisH [Actinomycetes bacterium]